MANQKKYQRLSRNILLTLSLGMFSLIPSALALPSQGSYDNSSTAAITTADSTMSITGKSTNNVLNWQSFSIAKGETVAFDSNNYLNLVNDSTKSTIYGTLTGGGTIYLVNPNGILFGSTAQVNVGHLVASTRPISEVDSTDFTSSGTNPLSSTASSAAGDIINQGSLQANSVTLEGNDIVLTNTANITSDGSTPLTAVSIKASGAIDIGYSAGTEATGVNSTEYTTGNIDTTQSATKLGYTATSLSGKTATINDCMLVRNKYELQNMQNNLAGNYMLANDIDTSGFSFTSIGGSSAYSGVFDGGCFTISGLTVDSSSANAGLFGYAKKATLRNVTLSSASISGASAVGALVGYSDSNTIDNVSVSGTITSTGNKVGGIAGYSTNSTITNSSVTSGSVTGAQYVGGIVGYDVANTIKKSYNLASVTAAKLVGGITGESDGSTISEVYNGGTVLGNSTSSQYVGGISGRLASASTITNALNSGTVTTGGKNAGGIVGVMESGTTLSYAGNTGTVSGLSNTAGIVGNNAGTISYVYDAPSSNDATTVSAIIGSGITASVTNAYYATTDSSGNTISYKWAGGGDGKTYAELTAASLYSDWDIATTGGQSNVWRMYDGYSLPLLKTFLTTVDTPTITKTYNGSTQSIIASDYSSTDSSLDSSKIGVSSDIASGKDSDTYTGGTVYSNNPLGYDFVGTPTLKINKAALLVNVNNATMTYGNSDVYYTDSSGSSTSSAYTVDTSSLKGSDTIDSIQDSDHQLAVTINNGALSSESGKTTKNAGTYAITATDGGSTLKNYYVTTGSAGTVTVNKANLTATVNDISTTYGTAFNNSDSLSLTGLVNGDTAKDVDVTYVNTGSADGTNGKVTKDAGTYTVTVDFGSSTNYNISYTNNSAAATVNKATLDLDSVKLADVSTTYGTAFDTSKYTIVSTSGSGTGLVNGDTLDSLGLSYTNTGDGTNGKATQNVGTYTLSTTLSDLTNYTITGTNSTLTSTATVNRAPLTLTADSTSVESGWATTSGYTGTASGFVNGDTSSLLTGSTLTFSTTDGSEPTSVGTHSLTGSINGDTTNFGQNYYLVQDSSNSSALTITAKTGLSRRETPVYASALSSLSSTSTSSDTSSTDTDSDTKKLSAQTTAKISVDGGSTITVTTVDVPNGTITPAADSSTSTATKSKATTK